MGSISKSQTKAILEDPVTMFINLHPDATELQISALHTLKLQYAERKQLHKDAQNLSGSIARQIGEAKRGGRSTNALKNEMQAQGVAVGELADRLAETRDRIMGYFEASDSACEIRSSQSSPFSQRIFNDTFDLGSSVDITLLNNNDVKEWNDYVENNPAASVYHRTEWRELIQKAYGHECYFFVARNTGGRIIGILPLVRLKSRIFGDFLVSMPYFKHGGAIADHPSIEEKLMQAANDHAGRLGIGHIEYRDYMPRTGLPVRSDKVNMILPLPDSQEELWKSFTSKLRAQIRRAERENPQIILGMHECTDDFYTVYTRNMRDLGSPAHSKQFIQGILDYFPDSSCIFVLRLHNQPVAAGLLLGNGDTLENPLASTIRDVHHLSINMLLYWEMLKFSTQHGYRYFNFGRSSTGTGTFRFKQQWGAIPKTLYWHYWLDSNHELPSLNPSNPKYALMIEIWKRLPVTITKWIGPGIIKYLP